MQFAKLRYLIIYLLLVVFLDACKPKDEVFPTISIIQPTIGTIYNVYDTVFVGVEAIDETELQSVNVRLVDANFVSISVTKSVSINASNSEGFAELIITDKQLETGTYHVVATAFDGINESHAYQEIRIFELPQKRRGIYFSTQGQFGQIWILDSLFSAVESWVNPMQDIGKLCVNSRFDRITVVGNISRELQTFDLANTSVLWFDDAVNVGQIQRFTDLLCFENTVYAAFFDKEIRSYSASGALTMNELTGNYRPEVLYADDIFLVAGMTLVGGNTNHIFVFNRLSRVLLWQQQLPMSVKAICKLENDDILLFGNDGNQARVLHYDIGNNAYWEPRQLPAGRILDVVKLESQRFGIAHETGLYSYTYNPNYLNQIGSIQYQDICFDVDYGTLIGATGNTLNEIHTTNGQVLNFVTASDSITSLDIHYTR